MNQNDKNKKQNKFPIFLIFILAIFVGFVALKFTQIEIPIGSLFTSSKSEKTSSDEESKLSEDNSGESSDDGILGLEDEDLEEFLIDEINKEIIQTLEVNRIKLYRKHIVSFSNLTTKFAENQNFEDEIAYLLKNQKQYSKDALNALKALDEYNKNYLGSKIVRYVKTESEGKIFARLIGLVLDIKKESPCYKDMKEARGKLAESIKIIEKFIFSPEFLKMYLSYD